MTDYQFHDPDRADRLSREHSEAEAHGNGAAEKERNPGTSRR
jgi:hypothetical protein